MGKDDKIAIIGVVSAILLMLICTLIVIGKHTETTYSSKDHVIYVEKHGVKQSVIVDGETHGNARIYYNENGSVECVVVKEGDEWLFSYLSCLIIPLVIMLALDKWW